jgi:hypothetical protein
MDELPAGEATEPSAKVGWSVALRSCRAFAVSQSDLPEKTETYQVFRHPEGGRRTTFAGRAKVKSRLNRGTGRIIRPRRVQAWHLRCISRVNGLGERCRKPRLGAI